MLALAVEVTLIELPTVIVVRERCVNGLEARKGTRGVVTRLSPQIAD